jgi:hypothetical protein
VVAMDPDTVTVDGLAIKVDMAIGDVATDLVDTYSLNVSQDGTCGMFSGAPTMTSSVTVNMSSRLRYTPDGSGPNKPAGRFVVRMTKFY